MQNLTVENELNGKQLFSVGDATVRTWDVRTGREIGLIRVHDQPILSVSMAAGDRKILSTRALDATGVWNLDLGKETQWPALSADAPRHVVNAGERGWAVTPDGRIKAADSSDGIPQVLPGSCTVALWEKASGTIISKLKGHKASIQAFAFHPNGKVLATGSWGGTVRLWEIPTGRELAKLSEHRGGVTALAFSPDGTLLAAGGSDTTVLIWNVTKSMPDRSAALKLSPEDLERFSTELAAKDASVAYTALWKLVAAPEQAAPFLADRAGKLFPNEPRVKELLSELDAVKFQVREQAMRELVNLGTEVKPQLCRAVEAGCSLEVRMRVEKVLANLDATNSDVPQQQLRTIRVVQALEYMGTPASKKILKQLAIEYGDYRVGIEAKAAIVRLK